MEIKGWKRVGYGLRCNPCFAYEKQFGDKTLIIRVERKSGFCDVKIKGESTVMLNNISSLDEAINFCEIRFGGN